MKSFALLLLLIALITNLTGCQTPASIDWNARVGTQTFDDTVKEFGPPEKSATLADGARVAEWLRARGQVTPTYHNLPDGRVIRTDAGRGPDVWLQLTFAPDGRLRSWKRVVR
jgi:uncharacterized membrane protein